MDAELSEQIESTIDALTLSRARAELVTQKMRKLGVHFGSEYDHAEGDIKRLISMLHYMRRVAERRELAEAKLTRIDATGRKIMPE
jgi:hypothetical protein